MYIHLGADVDVLCCDIVGVFDIDRVTVKSDVNDYLRACQREGKIYYVSLDLPRSFVVCSDRVYVTNVAAATIKRRMLLDWDFV